MPHATAPRAAEPAPTASEAPAQTARRAPVAPAAAAAQVAPIARRRAPARSAPAVVEPAFAVVKTRRAFEEIRDQIEREVAAGRLRPGDRLPAERDLAEQFGVSRTAVREALRSLEMAGIVECQKGIHGGPVIKRGDPALITRAVRDMVFLGQISTDAVTEARILVTNDAIRLACERATEEDLAAIERDIELWAELAGGGADSRRSADIVEFYRLLGRATHNEVIVMIIDSLSEIVRLLLDRVGPAPRDDVAVVRRRILRHLRARDADSAVREMTDHLQRLSRHLQKLEKRRVAAQG